MASGERDFLAPSPSLTPRATSPLSSIDPPTCATPSGAKALAGHLVVTTLPDRTFVYYDLATRSSASRPKPSWQRISWQPRRLVPPWPRQPPGSPTGTMAGCLQHLPGSAPRTSRPLCGQFVGVGTSPTSPTQGARHRSSSAFRRRTIRASVCSRDCCRLNRSSTTTRRVP